MADLDLRQVYRELRGHDVPPGELMAINLEVEVRGPDGAVVSHSLEPARSWVRQAAQIFRSRLRHTNEANTRDTGGTLRGLQGNTGPHMNVNIGASTDRGILVGTGTTPPAFDDFNIETLVAHGSAVGELLYGFIIDSDVTVVSVVGGYRETVRRQFTNDSGGNITITEAALVVESRADGANHHFLVLRDLINGGAGHMIPNGGVTTARYHFDFFA